MRIELHAIQYSASASQETAFYSAELDVDGRRIGTVSKAAQAGRTSSTATVRPMRPLTPGVE
jgi:hypothetical protein